MTPSLRRLDATGDEAAALQARLGARHPRGVAGDTAWVFERNGRPLGLLHARRRALRVLGCDVPCLALSGLAVHAEAFGRGAVRALIEAACAEAVEPLLLGVELGLRAPGFAPLVPRATIVVMAAGGVRGDFGFRPGEGADAPQPRLADGSLVETGAQRAARWAGQGGLHLRADGYVVHASRAEALDAIELAGDGAAFFRDVLLHLRAGAHAAGRERVRLCGPPLGPLWDAARGGDAELTLEIVPGWRDGRVRAPEALLAALAPALARLCASAGVPLVPPPPDAALAVLQGLLGAGPLGSLTADAEAHAALERARRALGCGVPLG